VLVIPSPNTQIQVKISPLEVSVKATSKGTVPLVGVTLKFATGPPGAARPCPGIANIRSDRMQSVSAPYWKEGATRPIFLTGEEKLRTLEKTLANSHTAWPGNEHSLGGRTVDWYLATRKREAQIF
jgi:hypothetical protein